MDSHVFFVQTGFFVCLRVRVGQARRTVSEARRNCVQAEPVRPFPKGTPTFEAQKKTAGVGTMYDDMTWSDRLVAYYIRKLQTTWMVHECRKDHCQKYGACSFFFPFTERSDTQGSHHAINRMRHVRGWIPDDVNVAAHNLDYLVLAGTPLQVQVF